MPTDTGSNALRRKRTCGLSDCGLPAVIVLRWPWSTAPHPQCAEHWQDSVEAGMVTHPLSTEYLAGRRSA